MDIKGKYATAKVFTDNIDSETIEQIQELCDDKYAEGSKIRVMADCHKGSGSIIGLTMTITDKIKPTLVGNDIGCGMLCVRLNEKEIDFKKLDDVINTYIPSGFETCKTPHKFNEKIDLNQLKCKKHISLEKARLGMLSLGSGNHFIEVEKDNKGNLYLVIHCGSRYLGSDVAKYYTKCINRANGTHKSILVNELIESYKSQGREKEIFDALNKLKEELSEFEDSYLIKNKYNTFFEDYLHDMDIAQKFATINRQAIAYEILKHMNLTEHSSFTTIHNYIDVENMILRKGSISAKEGELVLIPINMRDGSLLATGKGNPDYNNSAPHGAGRVLSRKAAKNSLKLEDYKKTMENIWTSSVCENTLDEAPDAYKSIDSIIENTKDTIEINAILKPVYNYKCSKDTMFWLDKDKNKTEIEEIDFPPGASIDKCVKELLRYKKLGKSVYGYFNGHKLYSDTVTLDSAYKEITGQTKQEFDDSSKKVREEYIKEKEEHAKNIPTLAKFWMEKGREVLEESKWASWDKIVPIRLNDLYQGLELGQCLDIIKILNNGTFEEAFNEIKNQGHSGTSFRLVCSMIKDFSSKGEEFINYIKSN